MTDGTGAGDRPRRLELLRMNRDYYLAEHPKLREMFQDFLENVVDVYDDLAEEYRERAATDALTGIANQREFYRLLRAEISRSERKRYPFAVGLLDLDNFKRVNDDFGHDPVGNDALITTAKLLAGSVREGDVVARYGGEEFGLILPETNFEGISLVAERIAMQMDETGIKTYDTGKPSINLTFSQGYCWFEPREERYDHSQLIGEMVKQADDALYAIKSSGKNGAAIWGFRGNRVQKSKKISFNRLREG